MKTFMPKQADVSTKWWVVDATDVPLGRLASQVAMVIRGKNKPTYTPHADMGDYVIVINCDKVLLTGNKLNQKVYRYHTMYPGGDKEVKYSKLMKEKSDFVVAKAIKGMLPKNTLGRKLCKKLRTYKGAEHEHQAQNPEVLNIKGVR